jgi:hypothetical protein
MRIDVRDGERRVVGRIEVDPARRPTRVRIEEANREVFLDWDTALDDAHRLRRCVVCGCQDLFRTKVFPQVTGLVVALAFAGAIIGPLGLANTPVLVTMVAVLIADVSILLFARQRLVCHRCRSRYHDLPIARYHRRWDRAVAERHAPPPAPVPFREQRRWWTRHLRAQERTVA